MPKHPIRRTAELLIPLAALAALMYWLLWSPSRPQVVVGAKTFTESRVLAEAASLLIRSQGVDSRAEELGGTIVLWRALLNGEISAYPEYTGTLRKEILQQELPDEASLRARLAEEGIRATRYLGFNNTYALAMREDVAERLGIQRLDDLSGHADLRYGFGNEFLEREDGWPALRRRYGLEGEVIGLEHQLAYRAVDAGDLDVIDVYTTDPAIAAHKLRVLEDDFFPRYDALLLYRDDLPAATAAMLDKLGGSLNEQQMLALNEAVELQGRGDRLVAAEFVRESFGIESEVAERTLWERLRRTTRGHFRLVCFSLLAAIVVAVPCGVVAAKRPLLGQVIVTIAEVVQTIPGLAMLVFLSAALQAASLPSLREPPVIAALFLYSLLPILRNTMTGLQSVPPELRESALALGLSAWDRLTRIELPLASRTILAGIKTTAVINVGYATLGGLIGAVCYGEPIMTGLRKQSTALTLEGAIPAACMALLVKLGFEWVEARLARRTG